MAMALLVGGSLSAQLGALTTRRLSPRRLRKIFALIVGGTTLAVIWDLVRRFV